MQNHLVTDVSVKDLCQILCNLCTQSNSYMLSLTVCVWDFQNNKLCDTHNLISHHYQIGRLVAISLHKYNDHRFVVLSAHMHTMISLLFFFSVHRIEHTARR